MYTLYVYTVNTLYSLYSVCCYSHREGDHVVVNGVPLNVMVASLCWMVFGVFVFHSCSSLHIIPLIFSISDDV